MKSSLLESQKYGVCEVASLKTHVQYAILRDGQHLSRQWGLDKVQDSLGVVRCDCCR